MLPGTNVAVQLPVLLRWLFKKTSSVFADVFWQVMCWVAFAIDAGGAVGEASSDPLDLPQGRGPQGKSTRVPSAKKYRIAKMAAEGHLVRSGRGLIDIMKELRPGITYADPKSANKWVAGMGWQYLNKLQRTFKLGLSQPIYGITWDASRMSKRDAMIGSVSNSDLDIAGWCIPQVTMSYSEFKFFEFSVYHVVEQFQRSRGFESSDFSKSVARCCWMALVPDNKWGQCHEVYILNF